MVLRSSWISSKYNRSITTSVWDENLNHLRFCLSLSYGNYKPAVASSLTTRSFLVHLELRLNSESDYWIPIDFILIWLYLTGSSNILVIDMKTVRKLQSFLPKKLTESSIFFKFNLKLIKTNSILPYLESTNQPRSKSFIE